MRPGPISAGTRDTWLDAVIRIRPGRDGVAVGKEVDHDLFRSINVVVSS